MATRQEMKLIAALARLGRNDRELYRTLRAEIWEMVCANHARQTQEQRAAWLQRAS